MGLAPRGVTCSTTIQRVLGSLGHGEPGCNTIFGEGRPTHRIQLRQRRYEVVRTYNKWGLRRVATPTTAVAAYAKQLAHDVLDVEECIWGALPIVEDFPTYFKPNYMDEFVLPCALGPPIGEMRRPT